MVQSADHIPEEGLEMPRNVQSWSPTLLPKYEECPYKVFLEKVKKIPEPERPPVQPNGQEWPNDRGSRLHDEAEGFVRGNNSLPRELSDFADNFDALRTLFVQDESSVFMEELWCFDADWNVVAKDAWDQHWARIKIDFFAFLSETHALTVDYKTGKREGNEIKHGDQVLIYAIVAFLKFEMLEEITIELWYLDKDEITQQTYTREQAMRFLPRLERRAINVTTDTEFEARPSRYNCFFCPYKTGLIGKLGPEGTGHCDKNPK